MPLTDELDAAVDATLAPAAPAVDPIDAAVGSVVEGARTQRRAVLHEAVTVEPDSYAKAAKLGNVSGLPADVVHRNVDEVERSARLEAIDTAVEKSANLSKRFGDSHFAKLAHDHVDALIKTEEMARGFRKIQGKDLKGELHGPDTIGPIVGPEPTAGNVTRALGKSFGRNLEKQRQGLYQQWADLFGMEQLQASAARKRAQLDLDTQTETPEFKTSLGKGLYGGGESLLQMAPAIGASILTGTPLPALTAAFGQVETEAYGRYRARGGTPGEAAAGAVGEGAVEVATELLPMGFLIEKLGKAGAADFLKGFALREMPTEQAATILQDAIDTAVANPEKTWGEYMAERPDAAYQTFLATAVMTGAVGSVNVAARALASEEQKAQDALDGAKELDALVKSIEALQLTQRDPAEAQKFLADALENGDEVFVDANVLLQELSPEQLALLPSVRGDLMAAAASGGTVRIPISELTTQAPGAAEKLLPHLKTDPNSMTQAEAEVFMQSQAGELKAQAEKILAEQENNDAFAESAERVHQDFLGKLQATNRFRPEVNENYATLVSSFYTVLSGRLGTTPEEMYARYPLQVSAENVVDETVLEKQIEPGSLAARMAEAHEKDGGFSINPHTGESAAGTRNYSVSLAPNLGRSQKIPGKTVTAEQMAAYTEANSDILSANPNFVVGAWYDQSSDTSYLDISVLVPKKRQRQAIDLAKEFNQKAIFDLEGMSEIETGGTGEATGAGPNTLEDVLAAVRAAVGSGKTVRGVHYSTTPGLKVLSPRFEGTGIAGAEAKRRAAEPKNYVNRVNFYTAERDAQTGPEQGLNPENRYDVTLENIYDPNEDADELIPLAEKRAARTGGNWFTALEKIIKERGYSGFVTNDGRVVSFDDVDVEAQATKLEQSAKKQTDTPAFKKWFGDSKVVEATDAAVRSASLNANQYRDGEPGYADPTTLRWFEVSKYPIARLKDAVDAEWFKDEQKMWADQGEPGRFDDMLKEPIANPVVIFDDGSGGWTWDGNHRIGAVLSKGGKTIRALVGVRPEQIKSAIGNRGTFDPDDANILHQSAATLKRIRSIAGYARVEKLLKPEERAKLRVDTAEKLVRLFKELPSSQEMAAVAKAGKAKRGWYRHSAEALINVFGPDAPRFAALLAATSPQVSVETNLSNALQIWKNWIAEGRPTDKAAIKSIMGRSVQGTKGEGSVLASWVNNTVRALSAEDPAAVVLSGPKVNSFMLNLRNVTDEVTNDAWMAAYAAVEQTIFGGSLTTKGDPGKGPGYLAMSARVREAAQILTKETGEPWTPAEVQETIWSWAKTVYETAAAAGEERSMEDLVNEGAITDDLIAATPDFRSMFHDEETARLFEEMGYGEQIRQLEDPRGRDAGAGAEVAGTGEEAAPVTRSPASRALRQAARRLDAVRADRDRARQLNEKIRKAPRDEMAEAGAVAPPDLSSGDEFFQSGIDPQQAAQMKVDAAMRRLEDGGSMVQPMAGWRIERTDEGQYEISPVGETSIVPKQTVDEDGLRAFLTDHYTVVVLNQTSPSGKDLGFYSAALKVAESFPEKQGNTAAGWIASLKNKGVKDEEIEWLGLEEMPDGKVSRQELIDFIRANELQVEEVALGGTMRKPSRRAFEQDRNEEARQLFHEEYDDLDEEDQAEVDAAMEDYYSNRSGDFEGKPRWADSKYVVPGGTNHVELVLTLPRVVESTPEKVDTTGWTVASAENEDEPGERIVFDAAGEPVGTVVTYAGDAFAIEQVKKQIERPSYRDQIDPHKDEDTQHYGDLGGGTAIGWIRANDRVGPNGEKIFFIEEIQSKRHQEGRKRGYAGGGDLSDVLADADVIAYHDISQATWDNATADERRQMYNAALDASNDGIPDAPFKKTWPELLLKRAIRYAAERGYDSVAWTTGEQQAERYNLKKHIERVEVQGETASSARNVRLVTKKTGGRQLDFVFVVEDGGKIVEDQYNNLEGSQLSDVVGVELANEILAVDVSDVNVTHGIMLNDLAIGGDGMKAFYDVQIPRLADKIGKKYGAKTGSTNILWEVESRRSTDPGAARVHALPLTDALKAAALGPGFPLFQKPVNDADVRDYHSIDEAAWAAMPEQERADFRKTYVDDNDLRPPVARGQIAFGKDLTKGATITLNKAADLSTFLHEAGHFFLQVYVDIANRPDAPLEIQADLNAFFKWSGVENLTEWNAMTTEQRRAHHERFARGFEAYLFEGKAPNPEMRSLFERFRAWLLNIYRNLTALDVKLDPEIRSVFDRMLATSEQIKAAEAERRYGALFESAEAAGMTPQQFAEYQALGLEATHDAETKLQARALRDMKWLTNAKGKILRGLQRDAAAKRKAMRTQVAEEVAARPVYAAQRFFSRGEIRDVEGNLQTITPRPKISTEALEVMFPTDDVPWRNLGEKILTETDGWHPDAIAPMVGFANGHTLVRAMLEAPPMREVVEAETDRRMLETYGDITSPDALNRAAEAAIHNEARAKFLETELNTLAQATGQQKILKKAAKAFAQEIVNRRKVRDVKPRQYEANERNAAKAALDALKAGDLQLAAVQKRNQLVNFYGSRAAEDALATIERGVRYLKKVVASEKVDPEYREQIAALLERYDLHKVSKKEQARRASLLEWVEAQREQGLEPLIDGELLNEAARRPYTDMTVEEFKGLVDAVKNIEHLGRLKTKLLTAAKQRELDAAADDLAASIEAHSPGARPVKVEKTKTDRALDLVDATFASHRKIASLARVMDGQQDGGPMWELFIRPLNRAEDNEAVMREQATLALARIFTKTRTEGMTTKVYIPEVGTSLTREARLVIALNTANEGNLQRLMDGEGWTLEQVKAVVDTLGREDIALVNDILEHLESYRDAVGAKEKRVSGVEPNWVEGMPFDAAGGTIRGGYFPIKYDPDRSARAETDSIAETIKQSLLGAYTRATTRRGHTKARAAKVTGRPIRKDLGVLFEHVNQVIHDLAVHEYLIDANRLLRHPVVDSAIRTHHGPEVIRQIRALLEDVAAGDLPAQTSFERIISHLRTGSTIVGLGWNLTTSLLQPLGLTQSIVRIGPKWVGKGISRWLRDASSMENSVAWIHSKSDFMRLRGKTMQREINEIRNKVSGENSAIEASFFWMIQKMQMVADVPTWLGQYEKSMAEGVDEATAVALADQAVIDSQGAGQIKDLSQVQRGGALMKLFTNFYSFFNTTYNQMAEVKARTSLRDPLAVGRAAVDFLLLITVPAVLSELIKMGMKGDGEDDEEALAKRLTKAQLSYLAGTMVGLRELGGAVAGFDYRGPAGLRFFQEMSRLYKQVEQGEVDEAALKALNQTAGIVFHYPAGQVQRTVQGVIALAEDETDNPIAIVAGPPKD